MVVIRPEYVHPHLCVCVCFFFPCKIADAISFIDIIQMLMYSFGKSGPVCSLYEYYLDIAHISSKILTRKTCIQPFRSKRRDYINYAILPCD